MIAAHEPRVGDIPALGPLATEHGRSLRITSLHTIRLLEEIAGREDALGRILVSARTKTTRRESHGPKAEAIRARLKERIVAHPVDRAISR